MTAVDLPVTGTIPESLRGRFLRNGPNPIGAVDPATYHWFGGDGMVHGVRLARRQGRLVSQPLGARRQVSSKRSACPIRAARSTADMDFAANTNVIGHAGKTLAIVEAGGRPIELSYELDTLRRGDFDGTLPNGFTAHPKRDPETGELHAVCYWWGLGNQVQYIVVDTAGKVTKVVPIETTGAPMLHDMGLVRALRRSCSTCRACSTSSSRSAGRFPYKWDASYPARIGVLPRDGGNDDVQWFDIDPCYIFHPMNTFDDGDRVVFDAVRHPKMFATELNGPNEGQPTLDRWTFDLSNGKVVEERFDDRGQEFPRHDERLHRQAVPLRLRARRRIPGSSRGGSIKHDLHTGTTVEHDFGAGTHAAEPVFVPASDDAAEDDGYVMTFVYDEQDRPQRPRHPPRAGLRRRPRRLGAPPAARALRLPRQLGARPRLTLTAQRSASRGPTDLSVCATENGGVGCSSGLADDPDLLGGPAGWPTRSTRTRGRSSSRRAQVAAR